MRSNASCRPGIDAARLGQAPKKSASSRSAEAGESLPCTMFSPISVAKSPRIEPGGASTGFVGPISVRQQVMASSPVIFATTTGPP